MSVDHYFSGRAVRLARARPSASFWGSSHRSWQWVSWRSLRRHRRPPARSQPVSAVRPQPAGAPTTAYTTATSSLQPTPCCPAHGRSPPSRRARVTRTRPARPPRASTMTRMTARPWCSWTPMEQARNPPRQAAQSRRSTRVLPISICPRTPQCSMPGCTGVRASAPPALRLRHQPAPPAKERCSSAPH